MNPNRQITCHFFNLTLRLPFGEARRAYKPVPPLLPSSKNNTSRPISSVDIETQRTLLYYLKVVDRVGRFQGMLYMFFGVDLVGVESEAILTSFQGMSKMRPTKSMMSIKGRRVGATKAGQAKREPSYRTSLKSATKKTLEAKKLPPRTSRKQVTYNFESEEETEEEPEPEDDYGHAFGSVESEEAEDKPVFTEFEADEELEEGLCIVRSLGGGKYEIVNLNASSRGLLGSEETGSMIKGNEERREMFSISKEQWEEAMVKTELAAKSAGKWTMPFFNKANVPGGSC